MTQSPDHHDVGLHQLAADLATPFAGPGGRRPVWVWRADGSALIWANEAALQALAAPGGAAPLLDEIIPTAPACRSLRALAGTPVGAGRIEILRLQVAGHQQTLVATCKPLLLGQVEAVLSLGTASAGRPQAEAPASLPLATPHPASQLPAETLDTVELDRLDLDGEELDRVEPAAPPPAIDALASPDAVALPEEPAPDQAPDEIMLPSPEPASQAEPEPTGAFVFKARSRPHRFSFLVDQGGRIKGLSSGLADAVGASTALHEGEDAAQAISQLVGDDAASVLLALRSRARFAEQTVWWPVSDAALEVPARFSGFAEPDGTLRVFGTVLSGEPRDRAREKARDTAHESALAASLPGPAIPGEMGSVALELPTTGAQEAGVRPEAALSALDDQLSAQDAQSAGLFAPGGDLQPQAPDEAATELREASVPQSAQLPGSAAITAAASALGAGFMAALASPISRRQQPEEATALAGEEITQAHTDPQQIASVEALDDSLQLDEAQAAGLWASELPIDEAAGLPAVSQASAEVLAAAKALGGGFLAGLALPSSPAQADVSQPAPHPDDTPDGSSATQDAGLSRPERLTFQEIARRLGARITGRDPDSASADDDAPSMGGSERSQHGSALRTLASTVPSLVSVPGPQLSVVSAPAAGDAPSAEPSSGEVPSGQVLPFTRTEPNAERMVIDRLPLGVIIYAEQSVLYANRAALELMGVANVHALRRHDSLDSLFAGVTGGQDGAMTLVRSDGSRIAVAGRLQSVRWDGQSAVLLSVRQASEASEPPTEETQSLPLIRARIGELEAIVDLASDGVVQLDASGQIQGLNQAAQALVGYSSSDLEGRPFRLLFAEDSRQIALDYLDDMAGQGRISLFNQGRELECLTAQGGLVPVFMTLGLLTDDQPATFCAVLRDLSPFKQAENDLVEARRAAEEANAHKSDFLARVSHEIRTPLNAVIGFSEVMLEERFGPVGSERYRQYLRDIHTSGEHLMSLLNDLLDLSKIEAGRMEMTFGEVDLKDVVEQCLAIMQPQASQGRIIVRTSLPLSVPKVVCDIRSIRQIVLNLMSNAIKFTDPGGQIIVSTLYEPTGEVSLRVRDTGRGMSRADIELALEPFRQVPTTLNQVVSGTGLGLPLTKALVEANRAQFAIESAPGEGTLAKVTFPLQRVLAE